MATPISNFGYKKVYKGHLGVDDGKFSNSLYTPTNPDDLVDKIYVDNRAANIKVTTPKIVDSAVTTAKIANTTVSTTNIDTGAVTTAKLDNAAVTNAKFANGAVTTAKILDANVTEAKIAAGAITSPKIATSAVTTAKIVNGGIDSTLIQPNSVQTSNIVNGAVTSLKIDSSAVTAAKLGTDAVTTDKIANGNVTGAKFSNPVTFTRPDLAGTAVFQGTMTFYDGVGDLLMKAKIDTPRSAGSSEFSFFFDTVTNVNKGLVMNNSSSTAGDGNFLEYYTALGTVFQIGMREQGPNLKLFKTSGVPYSFLRCLFNGATRFEIRASGDFANLLNSYGTISDARTKKDVVDVSSQWEDVKAMQLVNFEFALDEFRRQKHIAQAKMEVTTDENEKAKIKVRIDQMDKQIKEGKMHHTTGKKLGFVAQQLEESGMPGLVHEDRYGIKKVKQSVLLMKCCIAIQEAMKRVEELEKLVNAQ